LSARGEVNLARSVSQIAAWAEIGAFVALLLSYIWVWSGAFPGHFFAVLVLYFALGLESHRRCGERAREIGLRRDNFGRAVVLALCWLAPIAIAGLIAGRWLGGWAFPPLVRAVGDLAYGVVWGTVQEYGLVCVLYRRLRDVLPVRRAAMLAGGLLFCVFHLPNPLLMAVTLAMGLLACFIYEREPNLWVLGLAHGVVSFVLANALPGWLTFDWRVGPQILPRVLALF
jgi:membrane protease YdiL (CAAX protease family)